MLEFLIIVGCMSCVEMMRRRSNQQMEKRLEKKVRRQVERDMRTRELPERKNDKGA